MNCSRSRWRGWKTAARTAACRPFPAHDEDRERLPADPTTAQTQSRQPPIRLPRHESDFVRFGNPTLFQTLHFGPRVLHPGLTPPYPVALHSLAVTPAPCVACASLKVSEKRTRGSVPT